MGRPSRHTRTRMKALLLCAVLAACVLCLAGCKPTDFFTEVVISPFAENVDQNNQEKTVVNSPDATETSDDLASLSWKKNARKSKDTENLVTYSKKPTTSLNAHHSVFDTQPRFKGIKASDPVQLEFAQSAKQKKKKGTKQSDASKASTSKSKGTKSKSTQAKRTTEGASSTGAKRSQNTRKGTAKKSNTKNKSTKKTEGYDGKMKVYDPNNALKDPPQADKVAAIGQAAVLVQAIGGKGALAAMDRHTYRVKQSRGAASFAQVFADELASGFSSKALLWSGEGDTPATLSDATKLVRAVGKGGVIIYDQNQVDPDNGWFNRQQKGVLHDAGITFVPVSFDSTRAIKDAATVVGKVLSLQDAASAYCDALDTVTTTAKAAVTSSTGTTYTAIATDYVTGLHYSGRVLRTEDGLLFTRLTGTSGLADMATNAGVTLKDYDTLANTDSTYAVLWGMRYGANYDPSYFSANAYTSNCAKDIQLNSGNSTTTGSTWPGRGLGSAEFPYLIVSASGTLTASQVRAAVIDEVNSYADSKVVTPYSALPDNAVGKEPNRAVSTIGSSGKGGSDNLFYGHAATAAKSVRANPSGLLGSWTSGSVESVLETAWLARIYSGAPNSEYEPIDELTKAQLKQAVLDFYQTAYRYDASGVYAKVVTDEGEN